MKQSVMIGKSVGKNAVNRSADVVVIQKRLNEWIAAGKLPGVATLGTDGQCGAKTKKAIGAFQLRFVPGVTKPDSRADPGGKTVTHLGLDFGEVVKQVGDPVYNGWMETPTDHSANTPYWEKRGMFWFGAGLKAGGGAGIGLDIASAVMFNWKDMANYFVVAASTQRRLNIGAGASGGAVLCFATGLYHPSDMNKIEATEWDWNFSAGPKWASFAKWVAKAPKLEKLVSAMGNSKYANSDAVDELAYIIKNGMAAFNVQEDDPRYGFVTIDMPLGGGTEAAIYYGVTRYQILASKLL